MNLVASPSATGRTPVANGSRVPVWPAFFWPGQLPDAIHYCMGGKTDRLVDNEKNRSVSQNLFQVGKKPLPHFLESTFHIASGCVMMTSAAKGCRETGDIDLPL